MLELASETGLSLQTLNRILHDDLGLSKKAARWVPRLLSDEHKEKHVEMVRNFIKSYFEQANSPKPC